MTKTSAELMPPASASSTAAVVRISGMSFAVPTIIADAGPRASKRFAEFFTANIRNKNTRLAYMRAVSTFLTWCEERGFAFDDIEAITTISIAASSFISLREQFLQAMCRAAARNSLVEQ